MRMPACAAALLIGLSALSTSALAQGEPRTERVRVIYAEPTDPLHVPLRAAMQERGTLELLRDLLSAYRLPRELTLEMRGCNGREGAWYANDTAAMCYEYVALIQRHAPKTATPGGVMRNDAIVGGVLDTILHEAGHGIIEMLDIPVFGREEDAADFFSVYHLLQFPDDDARRLIEGVAFMMGSEGREDFGEKLGAKMFAGAHGLNAQRQYNVLCLAHGAKPDIFPNVASWGLPPWRARNCADEYAMLKRAFGKLILPHVDEAKLREAYARARFSWSPLATGNGVDKAPLGD